MLRKMHTARAEALFTKSKSFVTTDTKDRRFTAIKKALERFRHTKEPTPVTYAEVARLVSARSGMSRQTLQTFLSDMSQEQRLQLEALGLPAHRQERVRETVPGRARSNDPEQIRQEYAAAIGRFSGGTCTIEQLVSALSRPKMEVVSVLYQNPKLALLVTDYRRP